MLLFLISSCINHLKKFKMLYNYEKVFKELTNEKNDDGSTILCPQIEKPMTNFMKKSIIVYNINLIYFLI